MSATRDAAVAYAEHLSWFIFPCRPKDKRPLTVNGLKDASNDPVLVANMFHRDDANVAVDCGRSNLVVVDFDGPAALATLERYDETRMVQTARGVHCFYWGSARSTAGLLSPGVDTRGVGGYVLLPPSAHPSGATYEWLNDLDIQPLPGWLATRLKPRGKRAKRRRASPELAGELLSLAVERFRMTQEGGRNNALNREAFYSRDLVRDPNDLVLLWYNEADAIGLGHGESVATIASALGLSIWEVEQCL